MLYLKVICSSVSNDDEVVCHSLLLWAAIKTRDHRGHVLTQLNFQYKNMVLERRETGEGSSRFLRGSISKPQSRLIQSN